ncbi:MAG: hypothetical protein DLM68_11220 [Hyphomicrobiales bacterium]|nr:MAG: hypothetical protein DLM68_11220 [Hyphomicrobiales bacterium]
MRRKNLARRKPFDEVLVFNAPPQRALYKLSGDQAECQRRERLSFVRFPGLGLEDAVPGAKTLWLHREALGKAGAAEELFDLFDGFLKDKGDLARASAGSKRFSSGGKKKSAKGARSEGSIGFRRAKRAGIAIQRGRSSLPRSWRRPCGAIRARRTRGSKQDAGRLEAEACQVKDWI